MSTIYGNMVGGASMAQTYILRDSNGKEVTAVLVDEPTKLNATANDIREGKVAATENGVTVGEKVIPAYHTNQGVVGIPAGSEIKITSLTEMDAYDFTKLQAMICDFNNSITDSVAVVKVSIDDKVYLVNSTEALSVVTKNTSDKTVEFGITNDTDKEQILRFFTYKEIN